MTGNREPGTGNVEQVTPPCSNFSVPGSRFPVPVVDVIVVTWNARPYLEELVRGLCVVDYPRDAFTVHIVDNASSDGSADYVKSVLANPPENLQKVVLHEPGLRGREQSGHADVHGRLLLSSESRRGI